MPAHDDNHANYLSPPPFHYGTGARLRVTSPVPPDEAPRHFLTFPAAVFDLFRWFFSTAGKD